MFIIIWEYQIKGAKSADFESMYSPFGAWAELFKKSEGYMGTDLYRDVTRPNKYITIDRWRSKKEYDLFQSTYRREYLALDDRCKGLTESESQLGKWVVDQQFTEE